VRSVLVGAAGAAVLFGSLMAGPKIIHFGVQLQLRPDTRKYSDAAAEPDRILIAPVKEIVDAPKHGNC